MMIMIGERPVKVKNASKLHMHIKSRPERKWVINNYYKTEVIA